MDDLKILIEKIITQKPSFRDEVNEQLKCQYDHRLQDPDYAAMHCSALQMSHSMENFT